MKLNKPRDYYYYHNLRQSDDMKSIRKEYSRIRKAFNKAVDTGFGEYAQKIQNQSIEKYPVLKGLTDIEIKHNLAEMVNLSMSPGFTASGRRQAFADAYDNLKARNFKGVTRRNIADYISFFNFIQSVTHHKYTEEDLELFNRMHRQGFDLNNIKSNWNYYKNHAEEINKIPLKKSDRQRAMISDIERRAINDRQL